MTKITYEKAENKEGKWAVVRRSPYIGNIMSMTVEKMDMTEKEADKLLEKLERKLSASNKQS